MAEPARPAPTDDDTIAYVEAVHEAAADAGHIVLYDISGRWLLSWGTEAEPLPQIDLAEARIAIRNGCAPSSATG